MKNDRHDRRRHVSWNGISLDIPKNWQVSPGDLCHLNIEADFQAVMELRWQSRRKEPFEKNLSSAIEQYRKLSGLELTEQQTPAEIEKTLSGYALRTYSVKDRDGFEILFLHHLPSSTFFIVQCYPNLSRDAFWQAITTLRCHDIIGEDSLWSIQDFQVHIPAGFAMTHFKMDAGFTVLCFRKNRNLLHTLRLAPADVRLRKSSLEQICATLLGLADSQHLVVDTGGERVEYTRSPGIFSQVRSRLRKRNPFHRARLWHDTHHNRLLGVFMEGTAPIKDATFETICKDYEIVPD